MEASLILFVGFEDVNQIDEHLDKMPKGIDCTDSVMLTTNLTGPNSFHRAANDVVTPTRFRGSGREMEAYTSGAIAGMKRQIVDAAFAGNYSPKNVTHVIHLVEVDPRDPESAQVHMKWLYEFLPKDVSVHRIELTPVGS